MQVTTARRAVLVLAGALGVLVGSWATTGDAGAARQWASPDAATIRPGAVMVTGDAQCTANFVFTRGNEVFLGYAAHCAGLGGPTDLNGCSTDSKPLGTPVEVEGASRPGRLVYSSWVAMQSAGEQDPEACAYNDLALVRLAAVDAVNVNPSVPHWGGPTGLNRTGLAAGDSVYGYGSSSLRFGLDLLSPRSGVSTGTKGEGWSHDAYTVTPGIPGDSGSGLLDGSGRAVGVLSSIGVTPLPLSNSFGDLQHELAYARMHGMGDVRLALGTQPFSPNQLPIG